MGIQSSINALNVSNARDHIITKLSNDVTTRCSATSAVVKSVMLKTQGTMLVNGIMYSVKKKNLGCGAYVIYLEVGVD